MSMSTSNYDILLSPVVTEKSTLLSESNKVVFKVSVKSNKRQIKRSVEEIFKVKVKSINTLRRKGKTTNFRNIKGKRKDFKHAIITLEEGQTIDTMSSV
ncbi:MAG: 50S ribosomal protein L23 [Pseudomonadota bacterium]|nr:50S ribosomal protein L23 [Pseudomonadota bacterium]